MSNKETTENTVDRKDLKIQALLEKLANNKAELENEIADLRVELTILNQELQSLKGEDVPEEKK